MKPSLDSRPPPSFASTIFVCKRRKKRRSIISLFTSHSFELLISASQQKKFSSSFSIIEPPVEFIFTFLYSIGPLSLFLSYLSTRRQNFMAIWNGSNFTLRLPASFCVTFDWLALKCLSLNLLGRATISIPSLKNGSTLSSSGRSSCVGRTTTSVEIGSHLMCLTVCWKKALVVFRLPRGGGWHTRCFKYVRCSKHVTTSLKTVVGGC